MADNKTIKNVYLQETIKKPFYSDKKPKKEKAKKDK